MKKLRGGGVTGKPTLGQSGDGLGKASVVDKRGLSKRGERIAWFRVATDEHRTAIPVYNLSTTKHLVS